MVETKKQTKQIEELYVIRAFAMIAVVMIHATSTAAVSLGPNSSFYGFYQFLNVFSTFAVPVFIFLSGFVLFLNYFHKPMTLHSISTFYKKRIIYIILPYIVFSTFYFLVSASIYPPTDIVSGINTFIRQLLTGGTFYHLYFMFIIVQFYIVFPLLLLLLKVKIVARLSLLLGLIVQFGFIFFGQPIINALGMENGSVLFPTYFGYFFLGAYLGIYYEKLVNWLDVTNYSFASKKGVYTILVWILWLTSGLYYVYITYMGRAYNVWAHSIAFKLSWPLFSLLSAIVLFQLSFLVFRKLSSKLVNALIHIGVSSFGIYLIHPFILFVFNKYTLTGNPLMFHVKVIGGFFIVFALSWAITGWIMKNSRWSSYLFGASPKTLPHKK